MMRASEPARGPECDGTACSGHADERGGCLLFPELHVHRGLAGKTQVAGVRVPVRKCPLITHGSENRMGLGLGGG